MRLYRLTYCEIPTEYTEACFRRTRTAGFNLFGVSVRPTIDFRSFMIAIFTTYYTPIRPLTTAQAVAFMRFCRRYTSVNVKKTVVL